MESILTMESQAMKFEYAYTVRVGDLVRRLGLKPIDLVRKCNIGATIAYQACRNEWISLDTCYRIYSGLKAAGYEVQWNDVVQID